MARTSKKQLTEQPAVVEIKEEITFSVTARMELDGKYADVHQDEIENWKKFGWKIVGEK